MCTLGSSAATPVLSHRQLRNSQPNGVWLSVLTSRMHVLAGRRTTGAGTNFFALLTIRTLRITFGSSGSPNSERVLPLSPVFGFFFLQSAALLRGCSWIGDASELVECRAGQLVWARHAGRPTPSPHAIRVTCMQLLPLLEMYYRWELEEDCSNLQALLLRYDSEAELESHDLGRALLHMVWDDGDGLPQQPSRKFAQEPHVVVVNPFQAFREQLAAVDSAFCTLQPQVPPVVGYNRETVVVENIEMPSGSVVVQLLSAVAYLTMCLFRCTLLIQTSEAGFPLSFELSSSTIRLLSQLMLAIGNYVACD